MRNCCYRVSVIAVAHLTVRMEMEEAEKVRYIREGMIEQERLKLHTAQGKRVVPVLLRLQNSLNDIE